MFKCFRPDASPTTDVLIGLKRSRDEAASQADALQKQLEIALHKCDTNARRLEQCEASRLEYQHLLEVNHRNTHKAVAGLTTLDMVSPRALAELV